VMESAAPTAPARDRGCQQCGGRAWARSPGRQAGNQRLASRWSICSATTAMASSMADPGAKDRTGEQGLRLLERHWRERGARDGHPALLQIGRNAAQCGRLPGPVDARPASWPSTAADVPRQPADAGERNKRCWSYGLPKGRGQAGIPRRNENRQFASSKAALAEAGPEPRLALAVLLFNPVDHTPARSLKRLASCRIG